MTLANINYTINIYNNTLVLVNNAADTLTLTTTPGNYAVTIFLTALPARLATGVNNCLGIVAT